MRSCLMSKGIFVSALLSGALAAGAAIAAGGEAETHDYSFSFEGPFGTFDQDQLQRGLIVYQEVCSACHGLRYVPFRTLGDEGGVGLSEAAVKVFAANFEVFDPELEDMFRSWGASRGFMRWKVVLPSALPGYLRSLKTAMPLAFVGANLIEIIDPHGAGLGDLLISGRAASDVPLIFAVMLVQAVLVFLLHALALLLYSSFASWDSKPGSAAADGI